MHGSGPRLAVVRGWNRTFHQQGSVIVDSIASPAYEAIQADRGPDDIETYQLMQGRFFGGQIKDRSLERIEFQEVVDTLAKSLAQRNYYPNKHLDQGDLLLIVHFGVTSVDEDWEDLMGITSMEDEAALYGDVSVEEDTEIGSTELSYDPFNYTMPSSQYGNESNASLLGFDRELRKPNLSFNDELNLREALEEERYLIIVMAYDFREIRANGNFNLQWSTRFSIRSPGTNFEEAHFALSRAAAPHFGTNLEDLTTVIKPWRETQVEIGEAEVVESDVDPQSDDH
ncbi:hypothetical protein N9023_01625 [Opitutaceae bacterium]|nr:hypothetical protein [Opitutaceae bacterium]MDB4473677.1 hypothetical protein [Opitutaceae bacterium]